jgi:hypothetical protein
MSTDTPRLHGAESSPLGKPVAYCDTYAPELLFPIERQLKRDELGIAPGGLPFAGEDLWNAYELSWLNPRGKPAQPRYELAISLTEEVNEFAFRGDETATRANLTITADYVLKRSVAESSSGNTETVARGQARITTAYDILESQFATIISIDDARARSVRALSDDLQARLAVALSPATTAAR